VRRHIPALLGKGAKPVIGAPDEVHLWMVVDYGQEPEEIVNAIIREWQMIGRDPDPGGVWFALPHIYEAIRPHRVNPGTQN
jgi:hypothetical protein